MNKKSKSWKFGATSHVEEYYKQSMGHLVGTVSRSDFPCKEIARVKASLPLDATKNFFVNQQWQAHRENCGFGWDFHELRQIPLYGERPREQAEQKLPVAIVRRVNKVLDGYLGDKVRIARIAVLIRSALHSQK